MKYIKLSIIGLCFVLMAIGCDSGKGHPGVGYVPKIKEAQLVNVKEASTSFTYGDEATVNIQASDDNQDLQTLWVTEYYSADSTNPYNGPNPVTLPKQTSQIMAYSLVCPISLSGPPGDYMMDIQLEDASGNKSNVYNLSYTILGYFPKFIDAELVNLKDLSTSFTSGDKAAINVNAEDDDLNMQTLVVSEYYPADLDTPPYYGPTSFTLPLQYFKITKYSLIGPITLSGPAGKYRMDIQIKDAIGNASDVYSIPYSLQ
jgi:hypothetical protein